MPVVVKVMVLAVVLMVFDYCCDGSGNVMVVVMVLVLVMVSGRQVGVVVRMLLVVTKWYGNNCYNGGADYGSCGDLIVMMMVVRVLIVLVRVTGG